MAHTPNFDEPLCAEGLDHLFYDPDDDDEHMYGLASDLLTIAQREAQARRICGACKHVVDCALHGLEHEDYGVWGGLSQSDRSALGGKGISSGRRVDYALKRMARSLHPNAVAMILNLWRARQKELEISDEEEVA